MRENLIITIAREYGSNGRVIGRRLAEELGIPFYDKELILRCVKDSGIAEELFKEVENQNVNSFLFSLATGTLFNGKILSAAGTVSMTDRMFLVINDTTKKIASEGSCVIVGRCSNYILKDDFPCLNVFIHADIEKRIDQICASEGVDEKKARSFKRHFPLKTPKSQRFVVHGKRTCSFSVG